LTSALKNFIDAQAQQSYTIDLDCLGIAARNNDFEALNLMLDNYFLTNESEMAESTLRNSFNQIRNEQDH
jgi:hypothetical protein